jgi:cytosine/adenosine deaminase-related metal-dependent hydrolase
VVRDGWIAIAGERIAGVGSGRGPANHERDLGSVAVLPGLVNAHTHLELSYLRDAIPAADDFVTWIRGVMSARRQRSDAGSFEIRDGLARGIEEAVAAGTAAVGDISNTLVPFAPLAASPLSGVLFYELLRFNAPDPLAVVRAALAEIAALPPRGGVRASLAAHAPYSVAPDVLRAVRAAMDADARLAPCSIHLAESPAEVEFIDAGSGPWRTLLEDVGSWNPEWRPAGISPVDYADRHGWLDPRVLVVHGVQMSREDLARIAARGATLVTCPRSNRHTGAGVPPIEAFYDAGVAVAVGTDSLASTADLNVFAELAAMRALAPSVPAAALLDSATRQGARALGLAGDLGAVAAGYRARLVAVTIPPAVDDVEEYLVSGVTPDQIAWVA